MLSSELALRAAGSGLDELRTRLLGIEVLLKAATRSGLLISHTHKTLNRMGIFVHDECILAEVAARLPAMAGGGTEGAGA
ncbi:hypothetical protein ACFVGY_05960 [Streptomyces sp. NPDC127106]|uniref:hypothetical protein n=1 Tax=Streptomyces sp. NPDC127106 TaxID=3345360 RepID=UPI00363E072F